METIELQSLVGKHVLTGVDFSSEKIMKYGDTYEDCEVVRFEVDGITYVAIEDPQDGYRSCMEKCFVSDERPKTTFSGVDVFCVMKQDKYNQNDILLFYDINSSKIILEIGTDSYDDYYPCWVASWTPENLAVNNN